MRTVRWWMVRHAPVMGEAGRISGQSDIDADVSNLSPSPSLPKRPRLVVVSNLKRTQQTALALGHAPTLIEPALAEQNFGDWQGKRWEEISGPVAQAFWSDFANAAPPGGESFAQQLARVARAIERISDEVEDGDILAVLHGGTIRAALCHALSLPPLKAQAFAVDNLSLTRLERTGQGWRVGSVNERMGA
jgi:broad specificity phosphatase PhoE